MEIKSLRSAASIYNAVAKFSKNESPNYVDFYSYALGTKNEKLVQSILLIPEDDFTNWEKLKLHLELNYFGKNPAAENQINEKETWAKKVAVSSTSYKSQTTPLQA